MNHKRLICKQKSLFAVTLLLVISWHVPATAGAAETGARKGYFAQLLDGDVRLAPVGQRAGLHMTFSTPPDALAGYSAVHAGQAGGNNGGIHLSVRLPWK